MTALPNADRNAIRRMVGENVIKNRRVLDRFENSLARLGVADYRRNLQIFEAL